MKITIKEIASIQSGLFAKPSGLGELVYLQSKYFDGNGHLTSTLHADLSSNKISHKHLLKDGDVLFAAKGYKNFATIYEAHNQPAVASTSFMVIRPNQTKVNSSFLAWYLNSPLIQSNLKNQASGTSIPSISKLILENLEIEIPSLHKQQTIAQIAKLRLREKELKTKLEELKDQLIQLQITEVLSVNHD
jgi:restriction endonuclease S subunit